MVAPRRPRRHVSVSGNHALVGRSFIPLRGWYPIEVLHFPVRSLEQWEQKNLITLTGWQENPRGFGTAYHEKVAEAHRQGRMDEHYASLTVDDGDLARGIEEGSLTIDTRLRDILSALRRSDGERSFSLPSDGTGWLCRFRRSSTTSHSPWTLRCSSRRTEFGSSGGSTCSSSGWRLSRRGSPLASTGRPRQRRGGCCGAHD